MERDRFVYLTGLMPVLACSILLFFWLLTAFPLFKWLGLLLTPLAALICLIGIWHALNWHLQGKQTPAEKLKRQRNFLGHSLALGLGLTLSLQSFQYFRGLAASPAHSGELTITVRNTSMQPAKNLRIQVGFLNTQLKEIPPQSEQVLKTRLASQSTFTARIGDGPAQASIAVGPEHRQVLLRVDPLQNLLPEVN